ncbi:MAG: GyrI-like domain-containing protein [Chitinispirillales bacterium]|nr:GyrI-like domain-containing protein [Chitinispirillales bacterium]
MADVLDYKKKYKELYLPKTTPAIIDVPEITYAAVDGKGDPNDESGEFGKAVELLYGILYAIKMSKKKQNTPEGYFDFVVPPLEGFWTVENKKDVMDKSKFLWTAMIRLPEFVDKKIFEWACNEVLNKKKINTENAKYTKITEGLCVQCMHIGSFDDEPETIEKIENFIEKNNLVNDINNERRHHEIYLSDFRKVEKDKLKTVLRIPVRGKI